MFIDISYRIIAFILCVVSTILIVVVFINRNVPIIKGGKYFKLIKMNNYNNNNNK